MMLSSHLELRKCRLSAVTPVVLKSAKSAKTYAKHWRVQSCVYSETDLPTLRENSSAGTLSIALSTTTTTAARDQSQPQELGAFAVVLTESLLKPCSCTVSYHRYYATLRLGKSNRGAASGTGAVAVCKQVPPSRIMD